MRIKKKRKKRKWDWLLELLDVIEIIGQVLLWIIRGISRLIAKILN